MTVSIRVEKVIAKILLVICFFAGLYAEAADWPRIRPFENTFSFARTQDMYLRVSILNVLGKPAYVLECASPEAAAAHHVDLRSTRQFECRLSPEGSDAQLLAAPGRSGAEAERSGFNWNQVNLNCQRYPDYGAERVFLLRNMRLIVTLSNVRLGPETRVGTRNYQHSLQTMTVQVRGFQDAAAIGEFAAPARFEAPRPLAAGDPNGLLDCKNPIPKDGKKPPGMPPRPPVTP